MKKFEVGKTYQTRSICDYNYIFTIEVIKRTEKTLTIKSMDGIVRRKIRIYDNEETCALGNYSMAPLFKATREKV